MTFTARELEQYLATFAKAHGVAFKVSENIDTFYGVNFTVYVEDPSGKTTKKIEATGAGLIGQKFHHNDGIYTVTAFKPNRPKYPYTARGPRGGLWRFPTSTVINNLIGD